MGGSSRGPSRSMERPMDGGRADPFQITSPPILRFTEMDILDNSGGRRAGSQPRELFGEAAARRSIITPTGLRELVQSFQSME
jgi:hypothetical protein